MARVTRKTQMCNCKRHLQDGFGAGLMPVAQQVGQKSVLAEAGGCSAAVAIKGSQQVRAGHAGLHRAGQQVAVLHSVLSSPACCVLHASCHLHALPTAVDTTTAA